MKMIFYVTTSTTIIFRCIDFFSFLFFSFVFFTVTSGSPYSLENSAPPSIIITSKTLFCMHLPGCDGPYNYQNVQKFLLSLSYSLSLSLTNNGPCWVLTQLHNTSHLNVIDCKVKKYVRHQIVAARVK